MVWTEMLLITGWQHRVVTADQFWICYFLPSFRLNYLYGGLSSTRAYHIVNVLLHLICCLLLGELMGRLNDARIQRCFVTRERGRPRLTLALQITTVLVFGVQPVHTEAVRLSFPWRILFLKQYMPISLFTLDIRGISASSLCWHAQHI